MTMTMKKIFQLCAIAAMMLSATACYEDFDMPQPVKQYTDADFEGMTRMTIAEVKELFLAEHGTIDSTGSNDENNTKSTRIPSDKEYYIKGKVQSSDEEGNVYKSLHLVDETGAIEVKLSTGLYIDYPVQPFNWETGTMDSHYVYVKISGLYVGNYRMMLSIGNGPSDSYNVLGDHNYYANSNIENPQEIRRRVFLGEPTQLKLGEEILEITAENKAEFFNNKKPSNPEELKALDRKMMNYLGRLVIIRDVTCHYGMIGTNIYPSWMNTNVQVGTARESKVWYRWGVSELFTTEGTQNTIYCNLYGTVLFSFGEDMPTSTARPGVFTVRTSGYSRFAKRPIVRDGATGDIMAIFGIYSKYWEYNYLAYQLTVNRFQDIRFDSADFLTKSEADALTPADSWTTQDTNSEYDVE